MKKKYTNTPLVDEHLEALKGMEEAATDEFFYTRLKARMQNDLMKDSWGFPLKPSWLLGLLVLFLFTNSLFLVTNIKESKQSSSQNASLQNFASGYNLSVSTPF